MSKSTIAALVALMTVLASPLAAQAAEQGSGERAGNALSWHVVTAPAFGGAHASAAAPAQIRTPVQQNDFQLQGR